MKKIFEFTRAAEFCTEPDKIEVTEKALSLYKSAKSEKELKGKIVCHHRLSITLDGEQVHKIADLNRLGMYYNRPYFELIIMTIQDFCKIENRKRCRLTTPFVIRFSSPRTNYRRGKEIIDC